MWIYSLKEWIIAMHYCCCENLNDVKIQWSIYVAVATTEVCGLSWTTIVDDLFDYDCCFAFIWL